ncbi:MAG: hypothetical protein AB1894_13135 [Chloroflexota bacterium]
MTEKVLFEYRSWKDQDGFHYTINGQAREDFSHCLAGQRRYARSPRRVQKRHKKMLKHMRGTLDFYERMYTDLYGKVSQDDPEKADAE